MQVVTDAMVLWVARTASASESLRSWSDDGRGAAWVVEDFRSASEMEKDASVRVCWVSWTSFQSRLNHRSTPTTLVSSHSRTSLTGAENRMCARVASAPYFDVVVVGSTPLYLLLDIFSKEILGATWVPFIKGLSGLVKSTSAGRRKRPVEGSVKVFPWTMPWLRSTLNGSAGAAEFLFGLSLD